MTAHVQSNPKQTKVYLKNCRGSKRSCIKLFFTTQPNKQYCSAKCRHHSILESNRASRRKNYLKNKKRENLKPLGTIKQRKLIPTITINGCSIGFIYKLETITYLGFTHTIIYETKLTYNLSFYSEWLNLQSEKKETFHTGYSKGRQKDPDTGSSPSHQYVTADDLYHISTSYLKENSLKCPECGNNQSLVERALLICSNPRCGLVLKAPIIHPGFTLYDLTPIKKVAATVQDFPPVDFTQRKSRKRTPKKRNVIKEAHDKAYKKYEAETGMIFEEQNPKDYSDNDPMNPSYWKYYKNKVRVKH